MTAERKTPAVAGQGQKQEVSQSQIQTATKAPESQALRRFDAPTLRELADASKPHKPLDAKEEAESRTALEDLKANWRASMRAQSDADDPALARQEEEAHTPPAPVFTPLTCQDVLNMPPVEWAVEDLIVAQGIGQIFGQSGAGKTFLALDLAHALITGGEWFGHRIPKPRPVVYIGLEGRAGLRQRLQAITREKNHDAPYQPGALTVFLPDVFEVTDPAHVAAVAAACPKGAVVFIDTQNQSAPHLDENTSQMGELIQAAQTLARLVEGCVILIAHAGKDASKGARGWSGQKGAMDFQIDVTRRDNSKARQWTAHKVKDAEDGGMHPFELVAIHVSNKEDGTPIYSCIVTETDAPTFDPAEKQGKRKDPKWPEHLLGVLMELTGGLEGEENAVSGSRLKAAFYASDQVVTNLVTPEGKKTKYYTALRKLKAEGHVGSNGKNYWITNPE